LRLGMIGMCMNNEYRMCTNDFIDNLGPPI
jgi:hypothetical protein